MNNTARKLLSLPLMIGLALTGFSLSGQAYGEGPDDLQRLSGTGMFHSQEELQNGLPYNYMVVEFRIQNGSATRGSGIMIFDEPDSRAVRTSGTPGVTSLYLGIWEKKLLEDVRPPEDFPPTPPFYLYNPSKGNKKYQMDLHWPTGKPGGEDSWTMITDPRSHNDTRSLAERPVRQASVQLDPTPFPYRASDAPLRGGSCTCTVQMVAAADDDQGYTIDILNRNTNTRTIGELKDDYPKSSFQFTIPDRASTYLITISERQVPIHPYSSDDEYKNNQGKAIWRPIPMLYSPKRGTVHWTPSQTVYTRFHNRVPVRNSDLKHGAVYWLYLKPGEKVTLEYSYPELPGKKVEYLSPGWHFISSQVFGLTAGNINNFISRGTISSSVFYFDIQKQKYQRWTADLPFPECLILYKN